MAKWHILIGLPKDHMKLEYLHIGYWKLETCQWEIFHSGRCFLDIIRDRETDYWWDIDRVSEKEIKNEYKIMTDEDILLLDYKKRRIKCRDIGHDDFYCVDSMWISTDNYLMTGKKGNGCKKMITALLKEHGL